MSRRRKKQASIEKEKRKANQQRLGISSSNLGNTILYTPLSSYGCTFTQRLETYSTTDQRLVENHNTNVVSPVVEGKQTFGRIGSKARVVPS